MKVNIAARRVEGKVSAHLGSVEDIKLQQKEVTPTKDTQLVSADSDYNALSMVTVKPIPDEYIVPSGNQNITENGSYDITDKASVTVRVSSGGTYTPILQDKSATPTKSKQTFNADDGFDGIGTFTVEEIPSEYIIPSGPIAITKNGTYDIRQYENVIVGVEIPEGYIKPSGTKSITTNGTHDVKQYASATVNVPIPDGYIVPSGSLEITESGEYDVTTYAKAVVNVSGGGDLKQYNGNQWQGVIGTMSTTPITFNVGVEIPEKFYFHAWGNAYISNNNAVLEVKQYVDGTQYEKHNYVPSAGQISFQTATMANKITVSADRKSITISSPNSTGFIGGTWEWSLVVTEG